MKVSWIIVSAFIAVQLALVIIVLLRLGAPSTRYDADFMVPFIPLTPLRHAQADPVLPVEIGDDTDTAGSSRRQRTTQARSSQHGSQPSLDAALRRLSGKDPSPDPIKTPTPSPDFYHGLNEARDRRLETSFDDSADRAIDEQHVTDTPSLRGQTEADAAILDEARRSLRWHSGPRETRQELESLKQEWWLRGNRAERVGNELEGVEPLPREPLAPMETESEREQDRRRGIWVE